MSKYTSLVLLVLFAVTGLFSGANSTFIRKRRAAAECGETVELKPGHPVNINKSSTGECHWGFLGTEHCQPEIVCADVKLKQSGDCADEHLTVSDGIGGEQKLCGANVLAKPTKASGGGRDIYVDSLVSSGSFACTAQCSKNAGGAAILPPQGQVKKEDFKCLCGLKKNDTDRIVGGEDAKKREFPWQVALVKPGTRDPFCGGAVINNRYVLTAAHCFWFSKTQPDKIEVLIHAHLLDGGIPSENASFNIPLGQEGSLQGRGYDFAKVTDEEEGTQRYKVLEIINHPLFSAEYDYDAALLKLDRKVNIAGADAATPICLPKPGSYDKFLGEKP